MSISVTGEDNVASSVTALEKGPQKANICQTWSQDTPFSVTKQYNVTKMVAFFNLAHISHQLPSQG